MPGKKVRFAEFELDIDRFQLYRQGEPLRLEVGVLAEDARGVLEPLELAGLTFEENVLRLVQLVGDDFDHRRARRHRERDEGSGDE